MQLPALPFPLSQIKLLERLAFKETKLEQKYEPLRFQFQNNVWHNFDILI